MSCKPCTELSTNPQFCIGRDAYDRRDFCKAFKILLPLAKEGNVIAQCLVGSMFQLGLGTPQSFAHAKTWYRQAGRKGCAVAYNNLATICIISDEDKHLIDFCRAQAIKQGFELHE